MKQALSFPKYEHISTKELYFVNACTRILSASLMNTKGSLFSKLPQFLFLHFIEHCTQYRAVAQRKAFLRF